MAEFKIKDLLIKVLPEENDLGANYCGDRTVCTLCSRMTGCGDCTAWTDPTCDMGTFLCQVCSDCTGGCTECTCTCGSACTIRGTCGGSKGPDPQILGIEDLTLLKNQLLTRQAQIDRETKVREELKKPRMLEGAEALEQKLGEALREVKSIKNLLSENPEE